MSCPSASEWAPTEMNGAVHTSAMVSESADQGITELHYSYWDSQLEICFKNNLRFWKTRWELEEVANTWLVCTNWIQDTSEPLPQKGNWAQQNTFYFIKVRKVVNSCTLLKPGSVFKINISTCWVKPHDWWPPSRHSTFQPLASVKLLKLLNIK